MNKGDVPAQPHRSGKHKASTAPNKRVGVSKDDLSLDENDDQFPRRKSVVHLLKIPGDAVGSTSEEAKKQEDVKPKGHFGKETHQGTKRITKPPNTKLSLSASNVAEKGISELIAADEPKDPGKYQFLFTFLPARGISGFHVRGRFTS